MLANNQFTCIKRHRSNKESYSTSLYSFSSLTPALKKIPLARTCVTSANLPGRLHLVGQLLAHDSMSPSLPRRGIRLVTNSNNVLRCYPCATTPAISQLPRRLPSCCSACRQRTHPGSNDETSHLPLLACPPSSQLLHDSTHICAILDHICAILDDSILLEI
jgi:hypothetical protein